MLLIRGGQVLGERVDEPNDFDVLIDGDRIVAVGPGLSAPDDSRIVDASDHLVMPGLINGHTHGENTLLRGLGRDWTLEDLLNFGPALGSNKTPEDKYLATAVGALELLRGGCTAVFDMSGVSAPSSPECIEAVVQAYADVGMRAIIAPMFADVVFYDVVPGLIDALPLDLASIVGQMRMEPAEHLLRLTEEAIRRWNGSSGGRIQLAVGPTTPGESTDALLEGCVRIAREHGVAFNTHVAESKVEVINGRKRWGTTLVEHLRSIGALGPRFVGAHAAWLTADEIDMLADTGASVVHNPMSNIRLGCGIAPVREMLDRGLAVGLGTDGALSVENQSVFESMRVAANLGNVRFPHYPERWLGAETVLGLATRGGARVLGLEDQLGLVAPGRKADLVLLRADGPLMLPRNGLSSALVYGETGANVRTVVVGGEVVLDQGRSTRVDEASLRTRAQAAAERVKSANADLWDLASRFEPYVRTAARTAAFEPYSVNRYAADVPVAT